MLIQVSVKDKKGRDTFDAAYVNPDHISAIVEDGEHGTLMQLLGRDTYLQIAENIAYLRQRLAPFKVGNDVWGGAADKALADQYKLRDRDASAREAAVQASTKLLTELEKAAESIMFDSFYEDSPDKARMKLRDQFIDIVAAAIYSQIPAGSERTPDQDKPESS